MIDKAHDGDGDGFVHDGTPRMRPRGPQDTPKLSSKAKSARRLLRTRGIGGERGAVDPSRRRGDRGEVGAKAKRKEKHREERIKRGLPPDKVTLEERTRRQMMRALKNNPDGGKAFGAMFNFNHQKSGITVDHQLDLYPSWRALRRSKRPQTPMEKKLQDAKRKKREKVLLWMAENVTADDIVNDRRSKGGVLWHPEDIQEYEDRKELIEDSKFWRKELRVPDSWRPHPGRLRESFIKRALAANGLSTGDKDRPNRPDSVGTTSIDRERLIERYEKLSHGRLEEMRTESMQRLVLARLSGDPQTLADEQEILREIETAITRKFGSEEWREDRPKLSPLARGGELPTDVRDNLNEAQRRKLMAATQKARKERQETIDRLHRISQRQSGPLIENVGTGLPPRPGDDEEDIEKKSFSRLGLQAAQRALKARGWKENLYRRDMSTGRFKDKANAGDDAPKAKRQGKRVGTQGKKVAQQLQLDFEANTGEKKGPSDKAKKAARTVQSRSTKRKVNRARRERDPKTNSMKEVKAAYSRGFDIGRALRAAQKEKGAKGPQVPKARRGKGEAGSVKFPTKQKPAAKQDGAEKPQSKPITGIKSVDDLLKLKDYDGDRFDAFRDYIDSEDGKDAGFERVDIGAGISSSYAVKGPDGKVTFIKKSASAAGEDAVGDGEHLRNDVYTDGILSGLFGEFGITSQNVQGVMSNGDGPASIATEHLETTLGREVHGAARDFDEFSKRDYADRAEFTRMWIMDFLTNNHDRSVNNWMEYQDDDGGWHIAAIDHSMAGREASRTNGYRIFDETRDYDFVAPDEMGDGEEDLMFHMEKYRSPEAWIAESFREDSSYANNTELLGRIGMLYDGDDDAFMEDVYDILSKVSQADLEEMISGQADKLDLDLDGGGGDSALDILEMMQTRLDSLIEGGMDQLPGLVSDSREAFESDDGFEKVKKKNLAKLDEWIIT